MIFDTRDDMEHVIGKEAKKSAALAVKHGLGPCKKFFGGKGGTEERTVTLVIYPYYTKTGDTTIIEAGFDRKLKKNYEIYSTPHANGTHCKVSYMVPGKKEHITVSPADFIKWMSADADPETTKKPVEPISDKATLNMIDNSAKQRKGEPVMAGVTFPDPPPDIEGSN